MSRPEHSDAQIARIMRVLASWCARSGGTVSVKYYGERGAESWSAIVYDDDTAARVVYSAHGVTAIDALAQIATAIACDEPAPACDHAWVTEPAERPGTTCTKCGARK